MAYDAQLLNHSQQQQTPFFRFYCWQHPGLTQSNKKPLPVNLHHIDHAQRLTGGGLVFHCPGDIVFSHAAPIHTHLLPKSVKQRCQWFTTLIQNSLKQEQITTTLAPNLAKADQNINFCAAYNNPYELTINQSKIMGLALKKTRDWIFIQGVIHTQPTNHWFSQIPSTYQRYFTQGIPSNPSANTLINHLKNAIKQHFKTNITNTSPNLTTKTFT